jgi:hypothetical protein
VGDNRRTIRCVFFVAGNKRMQKIKNRCEEIYTVGQVRRFLEELAETNVASKVPTAIRNKARRLLKNYPYTSSIITKEAHV